MIQPLTHHPAHSIRRAPRAGSPGHPATRLHALRAHLPLGSALSGPERARFVELLHGAAQLREHDEFTLWQRDQLHYFLPHDILIAAWGDFEQGMLGFDLLSPFPGVCPPAATQAQLAPLLGRLFEQWQGAGQAPLTLTAGHPLLRGHPRDEQGLDALFPQMRSALVHGIRDLRSQQHSLYVLLSASPQAALSASALLEATVPSLDSALRQIGHPPQAPLRACREETDDGSPDELSPREREIMEWVRNGKTNPEIGMILDISAFTVKNHLQRIFRKLDVVNRAQAVAKLAGSSVAHASH